MSAVEEFESVLKQLASVKAPGVSGTRIRKLTELAAKNIDVEAQIVTKLYAHCLSTPSTHKLGALYVLDSILRSYSGAALLASQTISESSPEGTAAAGVYQIGELVDLLLKDALEYMVDQDERTKVSKLLDIWEKTGTFEASVVSKLRATHFPTTTPPGTPKPSLIKPVAPVPTPFVPPLAPAPAKDPASILAALANLADKSKSPTNPDTALSGNTSVSSTTTAADDPAAIFNMLQQMQKVAVPAVPVVPAALPPQNQAYDQGHQRSNGPQGFQGYPAPLGPLGFPAPQGPQGFQRPQGPQGFQGNQGPQGFQGNHGGQGFDNHRDRNDRFGGGQDRHNNHQNDRQGARFDNGFGNRRRSRSPGARFGREDRQNGQGNRPYDGPPQGHVIGEINSPENPHYRPKNLSRDNLPAGSIKVFSRTLFLGGVPSYMDDRELMAVLRPFGEVQSVILNSERKHAFVKVYSRPEAESVINDFGKSSQLPIRIRWGVGFGPRDCCDYQHGVSIIPIARLTEADKKWCVKAEWGGTNGVPLESGMVMDEPDIEIGTGVSSKAISKKMPTNSARNGPKSNKPGEAEERYVSTDYRSGQQQPGFMAGMGAANPLANMWGNNGPQQGMPQAPMGMAPPTQAPGQPDFAAMMQTMAAMNGGQAPDFNQMAAFFQQQQNPQR